jgi:hypothetical protein
MENLSPNLVTVLSFIRSHKPLPIFGEMSAVL